MSLTIVRPDGREYPLDFWEVITRHFSRLGEHVEWRGNKINRQFVPIALMVQVHSNENPDSVAETTFFAVVKITDTETCTVARLRAEAGGSQQARQVADRAASMSCLSPLDN